MKIGSAQPCERVEELERINQDLIVRFTHKREEGLTVYLRKAMEAVERAKREEAAREIERLAGENMP